MSGLAAIRSQRARETQLAHELAMRRARHAAPVTVRQARPGELEALKARAEAHRGPRRFP
jgi:hypothetical protein